MEKQKTKTIIEFTPDGYKMSAYDRGMLAGAIMDIDNVEVVCKEFCSADKEITIVLKNVFIAVDWNLPKQ